MNDKELQSKLADLIAEIEKSGTASNLHEQLKRGKGSIGELFDRARIEIKYLIFDLQASRRENRYLTKMLEETGRN